MKNLFDLKTLFLTASIAFGWGGTYMATSAKIDQITGDASQHVTRKEFALQQALVAYRIDNNKENIAEINKHIERIYERYGWKRD